MSKWFSVVSAFLKLNIGFELIASLNLEPLPIWLLGDEVLYLASMDPLLFGEAGPFYLSKFLVELLLIIFWDCFEVGGGSISLFKEFVV